jgi:riboflavin-specific deaminase-like protein
MGAADQPGLEGPPELRRLLPAGEPATPAAIAARVEDAAEQAERGAPYVILNMISTVDGRASIDGRSGGLSNEVDRSLFHALRAVVDAVLVGAGTVRTERYGRMLRDPAVRSRRREAGRSEEPLACVVSGGLELPLDLPLLAEPQARVVIVTSSPSSLSGVAAQVEYVRAAHEGALDLAAALAELHERFGVRTLLCEGGPHLNAHLLAAGMVHELFLTLSPLLAGGDPDAGEALRIIAGAGLGEPLGLELLGLLESGSQLFLRYRVGA